MNVLFMNHARTMEHARTTMDHIFAHAQKDGREKTVKRVYILINDFSHLFKQIRSNSRYILFLLFCFDVRCK